MGPAHLATTVCLATLLSACGGGEGGVASTPNPVASANVDLVNIQKSQSFTASAAAFKFFVTPNGSATFPATNGGILVGSNERTTIDYDATTRSYTVYANSTYSDAKQLAFHEASRVADSSNAAITTYQRQAGTTSDTLVLFNPGPSNPTLALTYTSYGAWQRIEQDGTELNVSTAFYNYGVLTRPQDMPRTGSASYQALIDGQYASATGVFALSGDSSLDANFGTGSISFSMTPSGRNVLTGALLSFSTIDGKGTIDYANSAFSASASRSATGYSVNILGNFFGPQASEIGGTFTISNGYGTEIGAGVGAIVGKAQ